METVSAGSREAQIWREGSELELRAGEAPRKQAVGVGGRHEGVGEERRRKAESGVLSVSVEDFLSGCRSLELPADSQVRPSVCNGGE